MVPASCSSSASATVTSTGAAHDATRRRRGGPSTQCSRAAAMRRAVTLSLSASSAVRHYVRAGLGQLTVVGLVVKGVDRVALGVALGLVLKQVQAVLQLVPIVEGLAGRHGNVARQVGRATVNAKPISAWDGMTEACTAPCARALDENTMHEQCARACQCHYVIAIVRHAVSRGHAAQQLPRSPPSTRGSPPAACPRAPPAPRLHAAASSQGICGISVYVVVGLRALG